MKSRFHYDPGNAVIANGRKKKIELTLDHMPSLPPLKKQTNKPRKLSASKIVSVGRSDL